MKAPFGSILVKCEGVYNYFKKHGSLTLYVDPLFKPGQNRIRVGEVYDVPEGVPDYMNIVPEVKVGDRLYFHYNALSEDCLIPGSDGIFIIPYDMIFCSVRHGKIIMHAGKILCSKVYDDDVHNVNVNGEIRKCRLSASGIIVEQNVKHSEHLATLSHIGTPMIGQVKPDVKIGDKIIYIKDGDFINDIEGVEYFVMNQQDIIAVV